MKDILEKQSKRALVDFIAECAQCDETLARLVSARFGKSESKKELRRIEKEIDAAFGDGLGYGRRGSWGYIDFDISDVMLEIEMHAQQGKFRFAFEALVLLCRKLLSLFEYQEECEISEEVEICLVIMAEIAEKTTIAADGQYIFQECLALADVEDGKEYGADYEDKFLGIAAKFVTRENRQELEDALAFYAEEWRAEDFQPVRLEMVRRIEGEAAAAAYIAANLRFPKIREIAFADAVRQKDFAQAEQLCGDAIRKSEMNCNANHWRYRLYSVYEATENREKLAETAREIFLSGDMTYYDPLKVLLTEQDEWVNAYPALLRDCEAKLPYEKYMEILAQENELALLMAQTEKHKVQIFRYGSNLAASYPAEVCAIFTEKLSEAAEKAYGRDDYQRVCAKIVLFHDAGYAAEAEAMAAECKLLYKRKPAFVDEINRIERELGYEAQTP